MKKEERRERLHDGTNKSARNKRERASPSFLLYFLSFSSREEEGGSATSELLLSWPRKGVSVAGASFRNGISATRKVSRPTITGAIPFHSPRQGCWPVQRHARHGNYRFSPWDSSRRFCHFLPFFLFNLIIRLATKFPPFF